MSRLLVIASFAALVLGCGAASAQETGGVALAPEILQMEDAQGRVLDHVLGRLQQLQQLRLLSLSGGGTVIGNAPRPVFVPATTDAPARSGGFDATLSLARSLRAQASPAGVAVASQQIFNSSQSLTVNAYESPVSIGNNNLVNQQVASSTAVSGNGNASASVKATNPGGGPGQGLGKPVSPASQSAVSNATSRGGGVAHAVSINNEVASRGDH